MLTDLVAIVGFLKNLIEKKGEIDDRYFEQFIQPTWEAFLRIHEDYKTSLKSYTESLSDERVPTESIRTRIAQDSIYANDLRSELGAIVRNLPSPRFKTKGEYVSDFVNNLVTYFDSFQIESHASDALEITVDETGIREQSKEDFEIPSWNIIRFNTLVFLTQTSDDGRKDATKALNTIAYILQKRYEKATAAYHRLRTSLLA